MSAVVLLSGGIDSTVLLHRAKMIHGVAGAIAFDYGQRHVTELSYARAIAEAAGVRFEVADLSSMRRLIARGSQTGGEEVAKGHYSDPIMRSTVVPNRNMIMLSVAVGYALTVGAGIVEFGAHEGDYDVYPDCRPRFVAAMSATAQIADLEPVEIRAPFLDMRKQDIVTLGARLGVDFGKTWSCYAGGAVHCGECGTCTERREAFLLAGIADPTDYASEPIFRAR